MKEVRKNENRWEGEGDYQEEVRKDEKNSNSDYFGDGIGVFGDGFCLPERTRGLQGVLRDVGGV